MNHKKNIKNYLKKSKKLVEFTRKTRTLINDVKHFSLKLIHIGDIYRWMKYKEYVLNQQLNTDDFVPIALSPYNGRNSKKLIAYYLPQFYKIPQNDEWYGRGFTEWSNCTKAVPQFLGHWQPHLPIDVGFYNLETTHVMHRQIELAKIYGIYGFCFYYYWFSGGEKIMEKPINRWLEDKSLNLPFMLFWANENWTNTWGAGASAGTKIFDARMKPDDVDKFICDILPFFKDERYIRIDGRPHLIIYQAKKDPYLAEFIFHLREGVKRNGIENPYISLVFPDDFDKDFDPRKFGGDAAVEFGAHLKKRPQKISGLITRRKILNPLAKMIEYDMYSYIANNLFEYQAQYKIFKGVMTNFDNTSRKIYTGAEIFPITPKLYEKWLTELLRKSENEYIFLAAWNEWAEGMHIEPDQRYGYAYLQATRNALEAAEEDGTEVTVENHS